MVVDAVSAPNGSHQHVGGRIASIDGLRGLIMALMALDHTRTFILGFAPDPTNIDTTTVPLFATRWITHLCAPGFLLLAGVAARLQLERRDAASLAFLLTTRGVFLIALELTIIGFAWIPDASLSLMLLQVIWARRHGRTWSSSTPTGRLRSAMRPR
jgi:uncharacterized membrane protein